MNALERWQACAHYVLAVLVGEELASGVQRHFYEAVAAGLTARHFPPGQPRALFAALAQLRAEAKPVHPSTLLPLLDDDGRELVAQLVALFGERSTLTGEVFSAHVRELRALGDRWLKVDALEAAAARLRAGDDVDASLAAMAYALRANEAELQGEAAADLADALTSLMAEGRARQQPTGLRKLDQWTGGFQPGELVAIVAPFKQRKTTLMLNLALNAALAGRGVALAMFEADRLSVGAMLAAMLATRARVLEGSYSDRGGLAWRAVVQAAAGAPPASAADREDVQRGLDALRALGAFLRIYDRTAKGGRLSDAASLTRVAAWDRMRYERTAPLFMLCVDHLQRIGVGSDYERMVSAVPVIEQFAREHQVTTVVLSQVNAAGVASGFESYGSHAKGGGTLDAAVDTLYTVQYRQVIAGTAYGADRLVVGLHSARYVESGKKAALHLDPASGLILEEGAGEDVCG
jgi:replicative DNA helicase